MIGRRIFERLKWIRERHVRMTNIQMTLLNLNTTIPEALCSLLLRVLLILLVMTIVLIPPVFHLAAILMSSWISDDYCKVGLFWTDCSGTSQEGYLSISDSPGFGWNVTVAMALATFMVFRGYWEAIQGLKNDDRGNMEIVFITTCKFFCIAGVLDLVVCSQVWSGCEWDCRLGISYYLTVVAGWMMVLFLPLGCTVLRALTS